MIGRSEMKKKIDLVTQKSGDSPQSSQQSWLAKQMSKEDDEEDAAASANPMSRAKLRWRAAGHAVHISTRNVRRFADGKRRNSVKEGAKVEAASHGHGPSVSLAKLSDDTFQIRAEDDGQNTCSFELTYDDCKKSGMCTCFAPMHPQ